MYQDKRLAGFSPNPKDPEDRLSSFYKNFRRSYDFVDNISDVFWKPFAASSQGK